MILAKTIKGWTIDALEGKNATHQMKKLTQDDLKKFRDRLYLPISDRDLERAYEETGAAPFFHPGENADEIQYMMERRKQLGGSVPRRVLRAKNLTLPGDDMYAELKQGSAKNSIATTRRLVRLLRDWMKDPEIGQRIVPIAPDEYRTFGMDSMFPSAKVYNPAGQTYESVDRKLLLSYKESVSGQMLHEGISEAGAMASATAAGSAYSTHGEHMIPFYIFYSMFGFQRTGDSIWAMADQLARGFLIGATAGRTTLTGEGLQHADGHSPLHRCDQPGRRALRPGVRLRGRPRHAVGPGADVRRARRERHLLHHRLQRAGPAARGAGRTSTPRASCAASTGSPPADGDGPRVQLLASGVGFPWIADAQRLLAEEWGVQADTWSVTSWNELARDAVHAEEWNLLHPGESPRTAYVTDKLAGAAGPVVAVSDYMRAVPLQIARWVPGGLPRARRRRLRLRRHPSRRPPLLPRRRPVGGRTGPPGAGRRR